MKHNMILLMEGIPAPVDMQFIPLFTRFYTFQVVIAGFLNHQQNHISLVHPLNLPWAGIAAGCCARHQVLQLSEVLQRVVQSQVSLVSEMMRQDTELCYAMDFS